MAERPPKDPQKDGAANNGMATEDMVRTLMKMNPNLRGDGQSTKDVVAILHGQAPARPQVSQPASKPVGLNLNVELERVREELGRTLAALKERDTLLRAHTTALAAERKSQPLRACEQIIDIVLALDPNLTQRNHQVMLQKEKPFLDRIGFTHAKLIAAERDRRKR